MKNIPVKLIFVTPIFLLLTHYLAVFPHEYSHSFMAWLLGEKTNPLMLSYGGTGWLNLLLLAHIDENVNYSMILSGGHGWKVALIAFAGAGIANVLLFAGSLFLLKTEKVKQHYYLYYFFFLFNVMNLGNFYDYVPIRALSNHGDVHNFNSGLGISPWWAYVIFGYLIALLIRQFFTKTLILAFIDLNMKTTALRAGLMILCVFVLFGFFGGFFYAYFLGPQVVGEANYVLSVTSFVAIPGIIVALWPTRIWVKQQLEKFDKNSGRKSLPKVL